MDVNRVSQALDRAYSKTKDLLNTSSAWTTLRRYITAHCDITERETDETLSVLIFKSRSLVKDRINAVIWSKALSDTPISYAMQLAETYHGFAEGVRNCEYSFIYFFLPFDGFEVLRLKFKFVGNMYFLYKRYRRSLVIT